MTKSAETEYKLENLQDKDDSADSSSESEVEETEKDVSAVPSEVKSQERIRFQY